MRLYLIRHGQTAWNAGTRAQGHSDIPLDAEGVAQARIVGEAFRGIEIDAILTSDLQRSLHTAQQISDVTGVPLEVRIDLRERSFGEWEGVQFADIAERFVGLERATGVDMFDVKAPGGESYQEVWDRVGGVVARLEGVEKPTVVVSHGGTSALLLARLLQGTMATARAFRMHNTAITELNRGPDGLWRLTRYNDYSHLQSMVALAGDSDGSHR